MTAIKPEKILIGVVNGDELLVTPAPDPARIDRTRLYTLAMPPPLSRHLTARQQNLCDVQAASTWKPKEMWLRLFGVAETK